jgi:hypothetical protein
VKKLISIIVFISSFIGVKAQIEYDRIESFLLERKNLSIGRNEEARNYVSVFGQGDINSSAISNKFFEEYLYRKAFLTNDLKQDQLDHSNSKYRLGADVKAGIYASHQYDNFTIEAGYFYRTFYGTSFNKDVFSLIFMGNSSFAGQSASLDPFKYYSYTSQNVFIGYKKNLGESLKTQVGVRLGFIGGSNMQSIKLTDASFYTETNGAYLEWQGGVNVAYRDKDDKGGAGAFTDLYIKTKVKQWDVVAEVKDIGFIHWGQLSSYNQSGTFRYDGYTIDTLFGSDGFKLDPITIDSVMQKFGLEKKKSAFNYFLPTTLHVGISRDLNEKLTWALGCKYTVAPGYIPRVYTRLAYYVAPQFTVVPSLAYGGFGRFDVELGLAKSFKEKYFISTNLFWLEYLTLPEQSSGHGMSLAFSMKW